MTNQEKPLVTIAIPTYNRAGTYLTSALQSVTAQTYPHLEIIVSDNCSTDHTEQVVKDFNDPRIRYVKHSENIGHCRNFNFCVEQARGAYFMLLQDDDAIDKDFVEACLQTVNDTVVDIGVIRTGTRYIDSEGRCLGEWHNTTGGLSTEEFLLAYLEFKTGIYLCSTLWNTKRLQEIGGFHSKHNLFLDVMAVAKLTSQFGRKDIHTCKASNRKHPNELTSSVKIKQWCEESVLLVETICRLAPDKKMAAELRKAGKNFIFRHNYNLAKKEKSPANRVKALLLIGTNCGHLYSFGRLVKYALLDGWKAAKHKIKQCLVPLGHQT